MMRGPAAISLSFVSLVDSPQWSQIGSGCRGLAERYSTEMAIGFIKVTALVYRRVDDTEASKRMESGT